MFCLLLRRWFDYCCPSYCIECLCAVCAFFRVTHVEFDEPCNTRTYCAVPFIVHCTFFFVCWPELPTDSHYRARFFVRILLVCRSIRSVINRHSALGTHNAHTNAEAASHTASSLSLLFVVALSSIRSQRLSHNCRSLANCSFLQLEILCTLSPSPSTLPIIVGTVACHTRTHTHLFTLCIDTILQLGDCYHCLCWSTPPTALTQSPMH